jgi:hypothetical protein
MNKRSYTEENFWGIRANGGGFRFNTWRNDKFCDSHDNFLVRENAEQLQQKEA